MSLSTGGLNIYSLDSQLSLGRSQVALGKSIQRLSSGLRINSSFDDPSGMSISEKMRGYIKGLKTAESNTQNGISYLQTAEGAATEIGSMLQRMRELAVEGANGIYTTNDISEIQKEMDQLKDEIDRIASSTEFNTKKLLNGDSIGAWNSSTSKVGVALKGPVADGNYNISIDAIAGKNQIQTSQILAIKDGSLGAELKSSGGTNISAARNPSELPPADDMDVLVRDNSGIGKVDYAPASASSTFKIDENNSSIFSNSTGYAEFIYNNATKTYNVNFYDTDRNLIANQAAMAVTGTQTFNNGVVTFTYTLPPKDAAAVRVNGDAFTIPLTANGDKSEIIDSYKQDGSVFNVKATPVVSANQSGYILMEFAENTGAEGITATTSIRFKFISAETGLEGAWIDAKVGDVNYPHSFNYSSNGFNVEFSLDISVGSTLSAKSGDKVLVSITDSKGVNNSGMLAVSGAGTVKINNGPTVTYTAANSLTVADNNDGFDDVKKLSFYTVTLNSGNGDVTKGSITIDFKENSAMPPSARGSGQTLTGLATIDIRGTGEAATSTTMVKDISNFYNSDGINICELAQEMKIYGNSGHTSITIEPSSTMKDIADMLTKAIVKDLDMGSGSTAIDKKLSVFNPTGSNGYGPKSVGGMFTLQSAITGTGGEISFIGNEALLKAFGFSTIQKAENNITTITAKDQITGVIQNEVLTNSTRVNDLIKGADVFIDPRLGVEASWDEVSGSLLFKKSSRIEDSNMSLHIVDNRTKLQIGVGMGQTMDISLPNMDTKSLGIDKTVITSQADAQKAITEISAAISKVTSVRGSIGAFVNRLDSTYGTLQAARENITASESRIRDVDVAAETTEYTSQQMMYQAAMAMLAQANTIPQTTMQLLTQR